MKRNFRTQADIQGPAQDWSSLQRGDLVDVTEAGGYTYAARVETKTEQSDVIWIRRYGMGMRHLLHHLDGTRLQIKSPEVQHPQ
jgi:hypothetical protein